ncbi:MAG TPA: helix-turn-helix domain-containing protein [Acidobacteriaceae bacterium]|jgi:excisionase family DNA binding protein
MTRLACPEGQLDIFAPDIMAEMFDHPKPDAPLPPLPFERNQEVDMKRAARILHVDERTVRRMIARGMIRAYKPRKRSTFRIEYASLLEHCDRLREINHIAPRRHVGKRIPDDAILPFPWKETIMISEVARHLDIDIEAAADLIADGELVAYQMHPFAHGPWRVHRPSFVKYLHKLRRQAAPRTAS